MSSRNSRKIEPIEIGDILTGSKVLAAKPSPVEHVASPSSPAHSASSPARASFQSHSRTMSTMSSVTDHATRSNRFSVSFPVQPSGSTSPIRSAQSPVREIAEAVVPESLASPTGPMDTNFLTAIATQERRVLELKEELARAEADLNKLKRQWAQHEAQKKRNEARSTTKLQPLQTASPTLDKEDDADGSSAWMQQEMERRKALLSGNRQSNRTVFSGSKHARTLSLLSPASQGPPSVNATPRPPRPPRKDSLSETARRSQESEAPPPKLKPITRAATTPDLTVDGTQTVHEDPAEIEVDPEQVLKAGKKMATDFRDGLWTFWEDLRQATVGDEATQIPPPPRRQNSTQALQTARKQSSRSSLRPSSRGSTTSKTSTDTKRPSPTRNRQSKPAPIVSLGAAPALADPSFWAEHGIASQQATPAKKIVASGKSPKHAKAPSKVSSIASSENDPWDTWDDMSPQVSRSSSAASESTTVPSTISGATSPRKSTEASALDTPNKRTSEASAKKDPIPWPALSNLGPKALRRTASHLMSEWERSLTPSPSKEHAGQSDYLGTLMAEAAAGGGKRT